MGERDQLEREYHAAATTVSRGFIALASVPLVGLAAFVLAISVASLTVTMVAITLAGAYAMGGGLAGVLTITSGAAQRRRLGKQLREIDEQNRLPEARVVIR